MTDRHAAYIVILDKDIREDDATETLTALRMIRGVASVDPVTADPSAQQIAAVRRDMQWAEALRALSRDITLSVTRP